MMDLDEAIKHSQEQVQEQAKKGCLSCAEEHQQLAEWLKELKAYKENTCGDAISRQAVEKITWEEPTFTDALNVLAEVRDKVRALPSVSPQQRTGRWIKTRLDDEPDKICDDCGTYCWKCSICGSDASGWGNYKYCPKCGAKMEVEDAD